MKRKLPYLFFLLQLTCFAQKPVNLEGKTLPVPKNMFSEENITYAKYDNKEIKLDLYKLKNSKKAPVVILLHGGGWMFGTRKVFQGLAVQLAAQGFAVANIDYTLSTEKKFPANIEDCKAAVRWIRANADKYSFNVDKIYGIGASAGGHIIAMAALTKEGTYEGNGGNSKYSSKLNGIVIMGAGIDQYKRVLHLKNNYNKATETYLGSFKENKNLYKVASPINHLKKGGIPILIIDGENDRPKTRDFRYHDFIKKMNVLKIPNEFVIMPKAGHADYKEEPFRAEYVKLFVQFLNKY